jgi:hypothetical protein
MPADGIEQAVPLVVEASQKDVWPLNEIQVRNFLRAAYEGSELYEAFLGLTNSRTES